MKTLFLILAMLPLLAIGQLKYEAYVFTDEAELIQVLQTEGFEYDSLKMDFRISKDGETLDFHYDDTIVTNFPDTLNGWIPEYSTEVYCTVARKGNIKLPSNKKVGGQMRLYYYTHINKFNGEWMPED